MSRSGKGALEGAGIGLRAPHFAAMLAVRPPVGWLEVHPENYLDEGPPVTDLEDLRRDYPLSLHAVGLSIAGPDAIDRRHLARLAALIARFEPALVSEHLSWCTAGGVYLNDLLPLPYTEEALDWIASRVAAVQEGLRRPILIENPSRYVDFVHSAIAEPAFLAALSARTGCGILLDINNVYVSAHNLGLDAEAYIDAIPPAAVREIHLAGHTAEVIDGATVLIDTHGARVCEAVWALYRRAVAHCGAVPTLVEWDRDIPALDVLAAEADAAGRAMREALEGRTNERAA
jgi:hypothetical protein